VIPLICPTCGQVDIDSPECSLCAQVPGHRFAGGLGVALADRLHEQEVLAELIAPSEGLGYDISAAVSMRSSVPASTSSETVSRTSPEEVGQLEPATAPPFEEAFDFSLLSSP
jgi:hypothetical protein